MKTTVAIPAIPEHAPQLPALLRMLAEGTERPDQVVVSLAEAGRVAGLDELAGFAAGLFDDFVLLRHPGRMLHGPNRQAATPHIAHELVIYQDADDVPHPQRIQVVKHFFANYDIMHLNHCCFGMEDPFPVYIGANARPITLVRPETLFQTTFPTGNFKECVKTQPYYGQCSGFHITAGMPCVRRAALDKARWKHPAEFTLGRSEDYEFNMECLFHFGKTMLIDADLVKYSKYDEVRKFYAAKEAAARAAGRP